MFIKICGVRSVERAVAIADAGANAIGLNFYSESKRFVSTETAREIVAALPASTQPVALFVNAPLDEVIRIARSLDVNWLQFHGDEAPEFLAGVRDQLCDVQFIRVFRCGEVGLDGLGDDLARCAALGLSIPFCLVDAQVAGAYGGTGKTVDWKRLGKDYNHDSWPPLLLAGGLTPENVAIAIASAEPAGVDVAGGVESTPGEKNLDKVRAFIQAAR